MLIQSLIRKQSGNPNESEIVYNILKESDCKSMVDVGAHTGGSLRPFALDGWEIHAFEPDKKNRKELKIAFNKYTNISVYPEALSNEQKENIPFYSSNLSTGISSLMNFHESHLEVDHVNISTLNFFCESNNINEIDFLKIDTEGYDFFVLKGMPWSKIKPRVILCEFEDSKTLDLGYSYKDMANFLMNKDYKVIVSEWYPLVNYGGNHKWRNLKVYPCELNDRKFGHGNLFAFKKKEDMNKLFSIIKRYQKQ